MEFSLFIMYNTTQVCFSQYPMTRVFNHLLSLFSNSFSSLLKSSLHRELIDGALNIYDDSSIDITTEKLSLIPKFGELDMLEVYHLRSFPLQNIISTVGMI